MMVNEGDGQGRSKENVVRVRAVFVDDDNGKPGGLEKLKAAFPPPHIIVESSPGKYHGYWFVSDMPLDQFTPMQTKLAAKFGSDPAIKDLPRVMRLPGFLHQKGEPFMTRIVEINEAPPYTMAELHLLLIDVPEEIPEGERNTTLTSIAGKLRHVGLDERRN